MEKYILNIIIFIYFLTNATAQPTSQLIGDVVMPPPNAASLGKYGDIPVSYFTGVPSINIPIEQVQEGSLNLPISLNYHGSGVRVGETASWVGIGWSLNAGGMISRTVQHMPDEQDGYYQKGADVLDPFTCTISCDSSGMNCVYDSIGACVIVNEAIRGQIDSEPDIFSFNIGGYNGKFFIDKDHNFNLIPDQKIKFETEVTNLTGVGFVFKRFVMITPDGTRYHFGGTPTTANNDLAIDIMHGDDPLDKYATTWHLIKIESHDLVNEINLTYIEEEYSYKQLSSCSYSLSACSINNSGGSSNGAFNCAGITYAGGSNTYFTQIGILGQRLTEISTNTSTINFEATMDRQDLDLYSYNPNAVLPKALSSINIQSGSYCKKIDLLSSYFIDTGSSTKSEYKRLRLDSLKESSCNAPLVEIPAHIFEYNGSFLPQRLSKAIDHWGYYNGIFANNNNVINIPPTTFNTGNSTITYGNAIRDADENNMKLGVLEKIIYPTGGFTEFDFESHKYYNVKDVTIKEFLVSGLSNCTYPSNNTCCTINQQNSGIKTITQSHIDNDAGKFSLLAYEATSNSCGTQLFDAIVEAKRLSDNTITQIGFTYDTQNPSLNGFHEKSLSELGITSAGDYEFTVKILGNGKGKVEFSLWKNVITSSPQEELVGGLRIKQIKASNGNPLNDIIKTYEYTKPNTTTSSGVLFKEPNYGYNIFDGTTFESIYYSASSIVPLSDFQGYHIGYSRIIENLNGNGHNVYTYFIEEPPTNGTGFPVAPDLATIENGQLKVDSSFNETDQLVRFSKNYKNGDYYRYFNEGVYFKALSIFSSGYGCPSFIAVNRYNIRTKNYRIAKQESYLDGLTTITDYEYGAPTSDHFAPTATTVTNSDNIPHKTHHEYVFDFSDIAVYDSMRSRNMIAAPIKTKVEINGDTISGTHQICDFFKPNGTSGGNGNDPIYPKEIHNYEMTWDINGSPLITGDINGWTLQTDILEYDMLVGKPHRLKQRGWEEETLTWNPNNKLITKRNFENFEWKYNYINGTRLVSEIVDIDKQDTDYEYDDLMRLKTITERDGNVKTTFDYKYQGQDPLRLQNYIKIHKSFPNPVVGSTLQNLISYDYLDGLGRTIQSVQQAHSPDINNPKDIVTAVSYDNQGRPSLQYEPYLSSFSDGRFVDLNTIIQANTTFTQTDYEASPLNRLNKITPPDWFSTHTLYGTNSNVITIPNTNISFSPNQLSTQTTIEADGMGTLTGDQKITFTDKLGRVILSRTKKGDGTVSNDTYTIYDNKHRVIKILPPGVTAASGDEGLAYSYRYDGRDRITYKKIPDQEHLSYQYNARDLPVTMTDGNLRANAKRMITKYDQYGRPTETGLTTASYPLNLNAPIIQELWTATSYDGQSLDVGASISGDQYIGKIRESKTALLDGNVALNHFIKSQYEYDAYGRMLKQSGQNHRNSSQSAQFTHNYEYNYDWADNITREYFKHSFNENDPLNTTINRFYYDHQGRLKNTQHDLDNQVLQNTSSLNYTHKDQLAYKYIGGNSSNALQKIDYTYLENGFLSQINPAGEASDLFTLSLNYNQGNTALSAAPQYNGNISQLTWQVLGGEQQSYGYNYDYLDRLKAANYGTYSPNLSTTDTYTSTYGYDVRGNLDTLSRTGIRPDGQVGLIDELKYTPYNKSNRIQKISDAAPVATQTIPDTLNLQGSIESGTYEATQTINASGQISSGSVVNFQAGNLTCLGANFSVQENFSAITAPVSGGGTTTANGGFVQNSTLDYGYDANGNMDRDPHKEMSIFYNYHNLPYKILFDNGNSIEWLYDASGTKWQKKVIKNGQSNPMIQQDYLASVEYRDNLIESVYFDGGRAVFVNGNFDGYQYYLQDHLGNNRVVFKDDGSGEAEVVQESHFYPFGMAQEGNWSQSNSADPENNYLYNGKELDQDFGLDWYHYGARMYDPAIGQFTGTDRFAEKYSFQSPYAYAANNPIKFIDVNGDSLDVSTLVKVDNMLGGNIVDNIISDLGTVTGLSLSVGKNGHLTYAKDDSGNATVAMDSEGTSLGSSEARSLLKDAIDNTKTIDVGYHRSKSYSAGDGIVLSDKQINSFIEGTSLNLDNRTLGYGMTFLHEIDHSSVGSGNVDSKFVGTTGKVVDRMNIIRGQMGFKWGQRTSYPAVKLGPIDTDSYIPFSSPAMNSLNRGIIPINSSIKIQ